MDENETTVECGHCPGCGVSSDFRALQAFGQMRQANRHVSLQVGGTAAALVGDPISDDGEGVTVVFGLAFDISQEWGTLLDYEGNTYEVSRDKLIAIEG